MNIFVSTLYPPNTPPKRIHSDVLKTKIRPQNNPSDTMEMKEIGEVKILGNFDHHREEKYPNG